VASTAPIPPVTILTVLRPDRVFWLFIIGLIIYGQLWSTGDNLVSAKAVIP
jgi:hypothetical protein